MTHIIDVREPYEYAESHVESAINIPLASIDKDTTKKFNRDDELIVYCRSGSRAAIAVQILQQLGFMHVTNGVNQQALEQW